MESAFMSEKFLLLVRAIERDLQAIDQLYAAIGEPALTAQTDEETLIVLAYRLHNLYNAYENIFQNIAATFENHVDDSAHWHSQLLYRMTLEMLPLRPAVIDKSAFTALDELRRFRHLFRYAYDIDLDVDRLKLVLTRALQLKTMYLAQFEQFLTFVRRLGAD
jgi:hypothetical protein